jgi:hypothetical protein
MQVKEYEVPNIVPTHKYWLSRHTLPGSINMQLYHGPKRNATLKELANADILLTTFETVSSDFVASETLRNISWFRIVLDEGKSIEQTQQAPSDGWKQHVLTDYRGIQPIILEIELLEHSKQLRV